jgi:hypothetical protein
MRRTSCARCHSEEVAVNLILLSALIVQASAPVLENDYLVVNKNAVRCAAAGPQCTDRVIVALGTIEFEGTAMQRGDVRVFDANQSYSSPEGGEFVEVVLKGDRPPVRTPPETIIPEHYNLTHHEGERFRVIEGRLRPGDRRERHTHNQRLVIYINSTRMHQWPDGEPERFTDFVADNIRFSEPTIHAMENIGDESVRNIVVELKP